MSKLEFIENRPEWELRYEGHHLGSVREVTIECLRKGKFYWFTRDVAVFGITAGDLPKEALDSLEEAQESLMAHVQKVCREHDWGE